MLPFGVAKDCYPETLLWQSRSRFKAKKVEFYSKVKLDFRENWRFRKPSKAHRQCMKDIKFVVLNRKKILKDSRLTVFSIFKSP